jgi:hypothetical protein
MGVGGHLAAARGSAPDVSATAAKIGGNAFIFSDRKGSLPVPTV